MKQYWKINNLAGKRAEILIYEQIGKDWWDGSGVGAKDFITDLHALDVDDIDLRINSLGGSVFEGNAIYNSLKAHKAKVHVKIDGIAASIASVIAMAGDDIEIPENGLIMIHDPSTYAGGTADNMRAAADMLDKIKIGIIAAYKGKTGNDEKEIADMMSAETWLTAQEAIDFGFADKMTGAIAAQANYDKDVMSRFRNIPQALMQAGAISAPHNQQPQEEKPMAEKTVVTPEITLEKIKAEYPEIAKALKEEGRAEGIAEGAKAEAARVKDVLGNLIPGHEALVNTLAFDGKTTGPEAAVAVLQAEKKVRASVMATIQTDAPAVVPAASADVTTSMTAEEKEKYAWETDEKLRVSFAGDVGAYNAYNAAAKAGRVKVLGIK